ncbi:hypothetical protein ACLKA7_006919 [Drosophila subpalustris]
MSSSSSSGPETEAENSESSESVEPTGPKSAITEENYNNKTNNNNNNTNNNNKKTMYTRKNSSDDDDDDDGDGDDDDDDNAFNYNMTPIERRWNLKPMAYRSKSVGTEREAAGGGQSINLDEEENEDEDEASVGYEGDTDDSADVVIVDVETADESIINVDGDDTDNDNTDNDNTDNDNTDNDNTDNDNTDNDKTDDNNTDNDNTDNANTDNDNTDNDNTENDKTDENNTDNDNTDNDNTDNDNSANETSANDNNDNDNTDNDNGDNDDNEIINTSNNIKTDNNETDNTKTDRNKPDINETADNAPDNNETHNDETDNNVTDNNETDNNETDNNETDNNETDNNETDNNETDNNKTDNSETDNNETDNTGTDKSGTDNTETDNETDNNETESNETENDTDNNQTDNSQTDNNQTDNNETDSNEVNNNNNENDDYNEYGEDPDYVDVGGNEGYNATTNIVQAIDTESVDDDADNDNTDEINQNDNDVYIEDNDVEDVGNATMPYASESLAEYRPGGYHPVSVGDCFQQRYFAIKKIGWGHYSTVWLCYDTVLNRYSAIKFVKSAELYSYSARHEIKLLKRLDCHNNHPLRRRVVHLTDSFTTTGVNGVHQCLVFDVLGDNMLMLIQRSGYRGLPLYNVKQIAMQVLQGLLFLHLAGKMIHTDLKPENVLLVTDDLPLRVMANQASKKFLDEYKKEKSHFGIYRRTIKGKCPAAVSFFQSHRKWLRNRGIEDLRVLAKFRLLSKQMAVAAIEGILPYMPYEGPIILTASDLRQYKQSLMTEQVGDAAAKQQLSATAKIIPSPGTPAAGTGEPPQSQSLTAAGQKRAASAGVKKECKALRKLNTDLEKFMKYVAKLVRKAEEAELAESGPYHSDHKRSKLKKPMKSTHRHKQPQYQHHLSATSSGQNNANERPNYKLIADKDPAVEPCKLKVVIADVGNACTISNHITEDIQTREYRAVEVILGAGYDTPADVWSAACLIWEMATGEYLFEPSKWRGAASPDEVHIASIIETCGPIEPTLINQGRYSDEIFDENHELHNIKKLNSRSMRKTLIEKFNWPRKEAREFANFLKPMLMTDPERRISAFKALMHPWLQINHETQK